MILKSYIIEKNINLINEYKCVLFYGENDGIKDDVKRTIEKTNQDAEVLNLFQEEIIKDDNLVFRELNNLSLFSKKKIIFIYEASDKIFKTISESLEHKKNVHAKLYIFSRLLEKKSKLRGLFEKKKELAIIPCYQDNERTLSTYITNKLNNFNGLSQEIINLIINNSNNDRRLINAEISKIKSLFHNKKINKENLIDLLNIKHDDDFNNIRDASLVGDKKKVNSLMSQIDFLPENTFFFIYSICNRINRLIEIQELTKSTNDSELALENIKPKIFWKDKPIYVEQLRRWDKSNLEKALSSIGEIELLIKSNSTIRSDVLIKNLLVSLCKKASNSY